MHELHVDNENMQYQFDQFDRRNKNHKQFGQNPRVYDYYRRLDQEKNMKQKQLQHLIVEEAAVKKKQ